MESTNAIIQVEPPEMIRSAMAATKIQREEINKQREEDYKLLMDSTIPEIQAICRLLGWKK